MLLRPPVSVVQEMINLRKQVMLVALLGTMAVKFALAARVWSTPAHDVPLLKGNVLGRSGSQRTIRNPKHRPCC